MSEKSSHYLEGKWFHTLINSSIQQQGQITTVLENNIAVCMIICTETLKPTVEVLLDLNAYASPQKWIQFYSSHEKMKAELEIFKGR